MSKQVFDLPRVDVQGDDTRDAEILEHGSDSSRCQAFPSLFFVLPGIRIHGKHEVDAVGSRLHRSIDRDENVEDMIIDRHDTMIRPIVEVDRLVVFDILKNIDVFAAHGFEDFGLHFAVREKSVPGVDLEVGGSVLVRRPRHVEKTRVRVVREIDLPYRQFLTDVIPRGKGLCLPVETPLVNPGQLPNHLVRECFCSGASENSQLCWGRNNSWGRRLGNGVVGFNLYRFDAFVNLDKQGKDPSDKLLDGNDERTISRRAENKRCGSPDLDPREVTIACVPVLYPVPPGRGVENELT